MPDHIKTPSLDILKLRMKLTIEEVEEFYDALLADRNIDPYGAISHIKFGFKMINKGIEQLEATDFDVNLVEVADALTDINYVNEGAGVAFGIDLDRCFAEVQRSNMSKLDENGQPIRREDGKIMKSSLYTPPNLVKVLAEQGWFSNERT